MNDLGSTNAILRMSNKKLRITNTELVEILRGLLSILPGEPIPYTDAHEYIEKAKLAIWTAECVDCVPLGELEEERL